MDNEKKITQDIRKGINFLCSNMTDKYGVDDDTTLSIIKEQFL